MKEQERIREASAPTGAFEYMSHSLPLEGASGDDALKIPAHDALGAAGSNCSSSGSDGRGNAAGSSSNGPDPATGSHRCGNAAGSGRNGLELHDSEIHDFGQSVPGFGFGAFGSNVPEANAFKSVVPESDALELDVLETDAALKPDAPEFDNAPIGVFDSGYGGLTVAREIAALMPHESIVYFGDTARCPYGPRDPHEVAEFVQQIGRWLTARNVKMLVIACNTATAAGLERAQQTFSVPVRGAVEPGARAAARVTHNGRVGVIGTKGTIESDCYPRAIRAIDAGLTVFSIATPRFVEIVENGIRLSKGPIEDLTSMASKAYIRPSFQAIAREYLEPLRRCHVDALVLACTHYPLLKALIGGVMGHKVLLVSSSEALAHDVRATLTARRQTASPDAVPVYEFYTTSEALDDFHDFGSRVFNRPIAHPIHVSLSELE